MLALGTALLLVGSTRLAAQQAAATQTAVTAQMKLAFVDSRVIIEKAPGRAAAESLFNKEFATARETVQKMQDTLQAMVAAYQKTQTTLTPVVRELKEKEIQDKQKQFENRANLLDAQMQQRQSELVQPMMTQIREVLEALRSEDGYTFIFDVGAQGGTIVAADKGLDLTDKVVARLKPLPVTAASKPDSTKLPLGAKPNPSGIVKPIKPPTE
jgi:outer membrane protein